jgi:integrase/recombinase XerC
MARRRYGPDCTEHPICRVIALYIRAINQADLSTETVRAYYYDLKTFIRWLHPSAHRNLTLDQLELPQLMAFKNWMRHHALHPATINRRLGTFRTLLQWAVRTGWLLPQHKPQVPRTIPLQRLGPRWITTGETRELLRAVHRSRKVRDIAVIELLVNTGIRRSELCALRWRDVQLHPRRGILTVRQGKGQKFRRVPLNPAVRYVLQFLRLAPEHTSVEFLFPGRYHGPFCGEVPRLLVRRYAALAGIGRVTPHILRHSFCKRLLEAGVSLLEVSALAGHENLETTRRYCEPSLYELQLAVDKIQIQL